MSKAENIFLRIVKGISVGAVLNATAWFLLGAINVILTKNEFELLVPITAGIFGIFVGGVIGGLTGLIQPNLKIITIVSIVVITLIIMLILPSFLSAPDNKYWIGQNDYWRVWLNLFGFIEFIIATICVAYIISKVVSPKIANSKELKNK